MKKILALLVAAVMLFAFAACGDKKTSGSSSTPASTESSIISTDENTESTESTENKTPSNEQDKTSSMGGTQSTPAPSTSKPTTSTLPSTPSTSSRPSEAAGELTKISFSTEIITTGMKDFNGIDSVMLYLLLNEKSDGTFYASYEISGWKSINVNNATVAEQDALLKSASQYQDFYYDFEAQSGVYWGWVGFNYGDSYNTYDELKKAINLSDWNKNKDTEYFPSEIFGSRLAISEENVKCTYDKKTGKLVLDGTFPFENVSIKNNQSITINGNEYKKQNITGYNMH